MVERGEHGQLPYLYRWDRQGRKGQPCKVTARSLRGDGRKNFNSVRVEFADGYKMVTSGNAIRRHQISKEEAR